MKKLSNNRGITLIEIIVSIAILSIIIAPFSSMFLTAAKINKDAEHLLIASNNVQQIIEQKIAGVDDPKSSYANFEEDITYNEGYEINGNQPDYDGVVALEEEGNDTATIYQLNDTGRIPLDKYIEVVDEREFNIDIYTHTIDIDTNNENNSLVIVDYSKTVNNPIKIGIEAYGDSDITINLSNNTLDDAYIYISQIDVDGIKSTSEIKVNELKGNIVVREVKNQVKKDYDYSKYLIQQIDVKISNTDLYNDSKELIDITTLFKRSNQ